MADFIDIAGPSVRAKESRHESGHTMIVMLPFRPDVVSPAIVDHLWREAQAKLACQASCHRICLDADQEAERNILEKMGFQIDGYEFVIDLLALRQQIPEKKASLPPDFSLRPMTYKEDIAAVVALEKRVHAADHTSRVNFDTDTAVQGMKAYYQHVSENQGVCLLCHHSEVIGLIAFMPDRDRSGHVHVSSVAIDLPWQGQGLFFPLLLAGLATTCFRDTQRVTAVTTTEKLLSIAKRYPFTLIGWSLTRWENKDSVMAVLNSP